MRQFLTVVGPDNPLALGIVDLFQAHGLRIWGPNRSAARFEPSKVFAQEFMERHGIPTHPLFDQGYASIGCAPCTRAVEPGADPRSGRWWWETDVDKECGIHCSVQLLGTKTDAERAASQEARA